MCVSVIAGYGGTRQVIRKTVEGDELFEKVQLKDLISEEHQNRVLIQMTKGLFNESTQKRWNLMFLLKFVSVRNRFQMV